jgi:hypothetical protein
MMFFLRLFVKIAGSQRFVCVRTVDFGSRLLILESTHLNHLPIDCTVFHGPISLVLLLIISVSRTSSDIWIVALVSKCPLLPTGFTNSEGGIVVVTMFII